MGLSPPVLYPFYGVQVRVPLLVPGTHMWFPTICNTSSGGSSAFFWPLQTLYTHSACTNTHSHKRKINASVSTDIHWWLGQRCTPLVPELRRQRHTWHLWIQGQLEREFQTCQEYRVKLSKNLNTNNNHQTLMRTSGYNISLQQGRKPLVFGYLMTLAFVLVDLG